MKKNEGKKKKDWVKDIGKWELQSTYLTRGYLNEEQREVNQDNSFVKEVKSCIQGELALILLGKMSRHVVGNRRSAHPFGSWL